MSGETPHCWGHIVHTRLVNIVQRTSRPSQAPALPEVSVRQLGALILQCGSTVARSSALERDRPLLALVRSGIVF